MTLWIVDSIHHDVSQHLQVQRMLPLKLTNLKTCVRFMKNSSSSRTLASSLTFFISAAVEPFGCSVDESVCVFSSQKIGLSSRIRMPSSTCKRDIMVLTISRSHHWSGQRLAVFFDWVDDEQLPGWMDIQLTRLESPSDSCCQSSLNNMPVNEFVTRIPLSWSLSQLSWPVVCTATFLSPVFDEIDHEDIVGNTDVNRWSTNILKVFQDYFTDTDI